MRYAIVVLGFVSLFISRSAAAGSLEPPGVLFPSEVDSVIA
jgi:hypothetical protein